jgi:uncharacterized membrane protein
MTHEEYQASGGAGGFFKKIMGGTIGYIIFGAVPAIVVGALLYHFKPSFIVNDEGEVQYEKVLMFAGIALAIGVALKMFLF